MLILIGFAVVFASIIAGYVLSGGQLLALWQPFEIIVILGAAIGAFIASNPMHVLKEVAHNLGGLFGASKFTKEYYMDMLALMHDLFVKCRKEGLIAIESDIEDPHASEIFQKFPRINKNHHVIEFICDYLRICSSGNMSPFELENLLDVELDTIANEGAHISHAVNRIAEGLPGFGIIAAVLGIVITMASIGGPPEVLGHHVGAALVGTMMGILFSYGMIGPLSVALEYRAADTLKCFQCLKICLMSMVNGTPPQMAVEFGRKTLGEAIRPSFTELEKRVRGG